MKRLGVIALLAFGVHAINHWQRGGIQNVLWMCNVATVLIGLGLLFNQAKPVAIGVSWLLVGNLFWILDLLAGGEFLWTSLLTHGLVLAIGVLGIRHVGFPKITWPWACLGLATLQQVTRMLAPSTMNINVAFNIHRGWERVFPSYLWYHLTLWMVGAMVFLAIEKAARAIRPRSLATRNS